METTNNIAPWGVAPWLKESGLTKQSQLNLAATIVNRVEEGTINPLEAKVYLKSAEAVIKKAMESIDEQARREAEKYGTKSFDYREGVKVELATVGTSYDYSLCNDEQLQELEEELAQLKKRVAERQKFLQAIQGHMTVVDEGTGEVRKLYPPVKTSTDGLKISFK